jgi:hypothetical protein
MSNDTHGAAALPTSSGLKQPYHLVDPSPWPLVGSLGAGLTVFGVIQAAHFGTYVYLYLGLLAVLATMFLWWRDVLAESRTPGLHSAIVRLGLRYGMALFIASEVMFFVGFFWAYFHFALYPEHVLGTATPSWPPAGIKTFNPFSLPFLNTMLLLLSGTTVTWAHHALLKGDHRIFRRAVQTRRRRHLSRHLLPGHRLPWLPRHRRHHFPVRLPDARPRRPVHAGKTFRLRSRRLVLALRGRGVAVPVRGRLPLGRRPRRRVTTRVLGVGGVRKARALPWTRPGTKSLGPLLVKQARGASGSLFDDRDAPLSCVTNGVQRLRLWWGRGAKPPPSFLPSTP